MPMPSSLVSSQQSHRGFVPSRPYNRSIVFAFQTLLDQVTSQTDFLFGHLFSIIRLNLYSFVSTWKARAPRSLTAMAAGLDSNLPGGDSEANGSSTNDIKYDLSLTTTKDVEVLSDDGTASLKTLAPSILDSRSRWRLGAIMLALFVRFPGVEMTRS